MKTTVLIIGFVWPEPNSSAAGSRMLQLIESFQKEDYQIIFASTAADSDFMFDVRQLGISKVSIELNNSSFDIFVKELQPSIVLFDRFMVEEQFGWRVAKECPDALRILDTEDLHCLRAGRQLAYKEKREFSYKDLISDSAKREIASIYRCDLSLIISSFEMDLLQNYFKVDGSLLLHFPFQLDPISEQTILEWKTFEQRKNFIFIGNFLHEPNWNAVQYLKQDIWPIIRKRLPDTELHIYGAYPSQKVLELNSKPEGFLCKGRAENAKEVVSTARVCLAPIRFGAGIKGKLIEAMQCGTPSITTSIGAEAMHGDFEWNGSIANSSEEIAEAAIQLYENQFFWEKSQQNGIKIIEQFYSKTDLDQKLISKINDLLKQLSSHRENNFTGAMLMHHTLSSTKYMSKWIEAKNR